MKIIAVNGLDGIVRTTVILKAGEQLNTEQMRALYPRKYDEVRAKTLGLFREILIDSFPEYHQTQAN
jgi:hypothetical protein